MGFRCCQQRRPRIEKLGLPLEELGDLDTLQQRLQEEVASSNTVVPWIALVGAWCRKPVTASMSAKRAI